MNGLTKAHTAGFLSLAVQHLNKGEVADAEIAAELSVLCDDSSFEGFALLGTARARRNDFSGAIPAFAMCTRLRPNDIASWTNLAESQYSALHYEDAANSLARAVALDADAKHPSGMRARALIGRAITTLRPRVDQRRG